MNDEPTTDDELLSAYLDGEATPEEAARVESDPRLSARAAALDAVRQRLAVGAPPADLLEDHVAAALAAFDDADAPAARSTPVADLSTRRRRLRERIPLGAVAAAVVVLALFGALSQLDSADDDTSSTDVASDAVLEAEDSFLGDDADEGTDLDAAGGGGDGSGAFSTGGAGALLEFSDTDELADHIAAVQLQTPSQRGTGSAGDAEPAPDAGFETEERTTDSCDAVEVAGADPATVTTIVRALVAGVPVTAVVTEGSPDVPLQRLVVVDERTCSVIDDRPL